MNNSLITDTGVTEPQIDESKSYLPDLVGEGKKFKDTEALAKGKAFADAMIEFQNKQMDELRADYKKLREEHMAGKSLQELIDQMKSQPPNSDHKPPEVKPEDRPVFNPDEVISLFDKRFDERETARRQENNFKQVRDKLTERYGNNHAAVLKKQIDDLGMTVAEADQMARSNPKLFERTFGLDVQHQSSFDNLPRGTYRPEMSNQPKRDYEYYRSMRKTDPDNYWSPKIQMQMHEDAQRLGDAFGI